jgi:hypothetical protein
MLARKNQAREKSVSLLAENKLYAGKVVAGSAVRSDIICT